MIVDFVVDWTRHQVLVIAYSYKRILHIYIRNVITIMINFAQFVS